MAPKSKKKTKKSHQGSKKQGQTSKSENKKNTVPDTVLDLILKPDLTRKWPKLKMKVPDIFLHKPIEFERHVRRILNKGIRFYQPYLGNFYTKISCLTFTDHLMLCHFFKKSKLPYHTFSYPPKRKLRMVIRGLPNNTDLDKLKEELMAVKIPVSRLHKMHTKKFIENHALLVLVVLPHDDDGKKILQLSRVLGHNVTVEPAYRKTKQCHRCQKWGHSQRYCNGRIKCVKCAGNHLSKHCTRNPKKVPPKCANCGGEHTASYRKCPYCPDSIQYRNSQKIKRRKVKKFSTPPAVVDIYNYGKLYQNDDYDDIKKSIEG